MKKFLDKYFPKKFRVRVSYFGSGKYKVQYAYYRFYPTWHALHFWFEQTLTGGTECWSIDLFEIDEAERVAKSLKTYQDVIEWYKPDEAKEKDFYRRKKEYYERQVPYQTKEFKND